MSQEIKSPQPWEPRISWFRNDPERREYWQKQAGFPMLRVDPEIGRNEPCFCGSGEKYKRCCLRRRDRS